MKYKYARGGKTPDRLTVLFCESCNTVVNYYAECSGAVAGDGSNGFDIDS